MPRLDRARYLVVAITALVVVLYLRGSLSLPRLSPAGTAYPRGSIKFERSSVDWSTARQHHTTLIQALETVPRGKPALHFPLVQYDFGKKPRDGSENKARRNAVRAAFVRSWDSYREKAWLQDELLPVTGGSKNPFGGWAATLVDSLDTMWIMGLQKEFEEAAQAAVRLDWGNTSETAINLFETTIRHLGGLLSAYDLSEEPALLSKANELGDMLYMAFDTPNRMPGFWLNFEAARDGSQVAGTHDPSASPASLSLEFTRLSQLTGDSKYYDAVQGVAILLNNTQETTRLPGMWPTMIDFQNGNAYGDTAFTLGALADSLYEYLIKMPALLGRGPESNQYERMYRRAMDVVIEHLVFRPMLPPTKNQNDILFTGMMYVDADGTRRLDPETQHLACFAGGMFALGGKLLVLPEHIKIGEQLARGCAWAYGSFPTGLMPEIMGLVECKTTTKGCAWDQARWEQEGNPNLALGLRHARDPRYILRPEAIESIFVLYRVTGQEGLRDIAWDMFQSIMKATQTSYANSAIKNVTVQGGTEKEDSMESFWLAETLKYFYLIFSPPDVISLDEYVFNTEAHPLKRRN